MQFTGKRWVTADGEIALEALHDHRAVTVVTSQATIEGFGLIAICAGAARKYDRGLRAEEETVRVFMADLI